MSFVLLLLAATASAQWSGTTNIYYNGGNVGIGTTSPGQLLQINSPAATQSLIAFSVNTDPHALWGVSGSTDNIISGSVLGDSVFRSTNKNILFSTDAGSSAQLYLKNGGNVGIGTTAPGSPLHVKGDTGTSVAAVTRLRGSNSTAKTTRLQFEDYSGTISDGLIDFDVTSGTAAGSLLKLGVNSTSQLVLKGDGNVGVGTH